MRTGAYGGEAMKERPHTERVVLTIEEAAEMLGVSTGYMYKLARRADFPRMKVGSHIRIPKQLFQEWVYRQAGEGGGDRK